MPIEELEEHSYCAQSTVLPPQSAFVPMEAQEGIFPVLLGLCLAASVRSGPLVHCGGRLCAACFHHEYGRDLGGSRECSSNTGLYGRASEYDRRRGNGNRRTEKADSIEGPKRTVPDRDPAGDVSSSLLGIKKVGNGFCSLVELPRSERWPGFAIRPKRVAPMKNNGKIPRPEYPRMQFRRESAWMNLNGVWDFHIDHGRSGEDRKLWNDPQAFDRKIVVPFCPESKLSGVEYKDFMESVFYHRKVTFPKSWAGKRIFLRFGGVDFLTTVWLDGADVGVHAGGSAPFSLDVTQWAKPGKTQDLCLHAEDYLRTGEQGGGKQCTQFYSCGCSYTRTTGIWQTVWAEAVPMQGLLSCSIVPNFDSAEAVFVPNFESIRGGDRFRIVVKAGAKTVATREVPAAQGLPVTVALPGFREWNPADPFLYDATLSVVRKGRTLDSVESYFAMRKVSCEGDRVCLNNRPVYLRFVLDQGFYPDGVWTAPKDADLKKDIERSMAVGFNGARLHQKVFEDRFHYWADRLGYLTWSEYASWGMNYLSPAAEGNFLAEWTDLVAYLGNHPSIIGWTPLNETWFDGGPDHVKNVRRFRSFVQRIYSATKAVDPSRPVNDSSGWVHVQTDLWTVHSYKATPEEQKEFLLPKKQEKNPKEPWRPEYVLPSDTPVHIWCPLERGYKGQPYLIDEWGGFRYLRPEDRKNDSGWGYNGLKFENPKDFLDRIRPQAELFASLPQLAGHCYTQLTDVEQEQNGLYTYARKPKADVKKLCAIFAVKPSWSAW